MSDSGSMPPPVAEAVERWRERAAYLEARAAAVGDDGTGWYARRSAECRAAIAWVEGPGGRAVRRGPGDDGPREELPPP